MPELRASVRPKAERRATSEGAVRGREDTGFYVVSYDIPDDRRRTKVHKLLSGYGEWQQFSLFECFLTTKQYLQLEDGLRVIADPRQDRVRIYRLCSACLGRLCTIGQELPVERTTFII